MKSIINRLARSQTLANLIFSIVLFGVRIFLGATAMRYPLFKKRLKEKNLTVQIKLKDHSYGRHFTFMEGKIISKGGIHDLHPLPIFHYLAFSQFRKKFFE